VINKSPCGSLNTTFEFPLSAVFFLSLSSALCKQKIQTVSSAHANIHIKTHAHIQTDTCTHTIIHAHTQCMHMNTCARTHMNKQTNKHKHTHTHTHTHLPCPVDTALQVMWPPKWAETPFSGTSIPYSTQHSRTYTCTHGLYILIPVWSASTIPT